MQTFTQATKTFIDSADWLTDGDLPAVIGLQQCAAQLDKTFTAAMLSQYRLLYNSLDKKRPTATGKPDPLDELLDGRDSGE